MDFSYSEHGLIVSCVDGTVRKSKLVITQNQSPAGKEFDVIVVGAGAAGVGVGVALKHAGIDSCLIIDRQEVGASFESWPAETRFITPSFPTNSIGMLDLNSVAIGVSPAYSLGVEHPTGKDFARHLQGVARVFELPIQTGEEVLRVTKPDVVFIIETDLRTLYAKHVVWATGEFQFPNVAAFPGTEFCQHTAFVRSYAELPGGNFVVIGGYESGIDAAFHLAEGEKRVRLFDAGAPWDEESSDPSVALSTYSMERFHDEWFQSHVELFADCPVESVTKSADGFEVHTADGRTWQTPSPPLLANGFKRGTGLVSNLFESREDGYPLLNERDESTITPGLFLCGPGVRHDHHVFCFIYKYRQRFAVVAKQIATQLGLPAEDLEAYRLWGMYLDDLSCCGEECVC